MALIVWKNFEADGVPPAALMGELIGRNLMSRMMPFECDLDPFNSQLDNIKKDPEAYEAIVRKVLEGERFLHSSRLDKDSLAPGDIFTSEDGGYLINIRPDCDCIARGNDKLDNLDLYLLRGTEKAIADVKLSREHGVILDQDNEAIIFPVAGGKLVCFKFKKLYTKKWKEVKAKRIGRLLPPYLTRLQQRYSAYLQRPGLTRLPSELFPAPPAAEGAATPPTNQSAERALEPKGPSAIVLEIPAEVMPVAPQVDEAVPPVPAAPVPEAPAENQDSPTT